MTKIRTFPDYPSTDLPNILRGWQAARLGEHYVLTGNQSQTLAVVPGPSYPEAEHARRDIEQAVRAMEHAPEMLLLLEHLVKQIIDNRLPVSLEYSLSVIDRIRGARPI